MDTDLQTVKQEVWTAAIPVRLTLSQSDITTVEAPPASLHVLLPRCTYLPSLTTRALDHFRHVLPPEVNDAVNTPWYEHDGLPLRWQYPAGVLFDLLHKGKAGVVWQITIHFRDFPSDTLISWEGSQPLLQAYLNSLKEAAVICSGNAASILQMSQQSQQNLWQSVETADLAGFQRVASSLQLTPKARGSRSASIPVRLLFQRSASDYMSSYESVDFTSRPVAQAIEDSEQTLLQALQGILPDCFASSSQVDRDHAAVPAQAAAEDDLPSDAVPTQLSSKPDHALEERMFLDNYFVLVCGVRPSLQTPLAGLHAVLHAPDMFLYINVIALR